MTNLHPIFQQALRPWIPVSEASRLAGEALQRIHEGEDGNRLVHIIRHPDGYATGLSSSFHPEADLSGYIERYRSLNYFAGIK